MSLTLGKTKKRYRHEYKFLITPHDYFVLRQRIKAIMQRDPNVGADGQYHIRSLYFDDVYDSSLIEKNAGVNRREKFRIRIYNKSDELIKLERKSKLNNYINKESSNLSRDEFYSILNGDIDFLLSKEKPVCKLFYARAKTNLMKPSVIVDYVREPYVYDAGGVRVTFDMKLEAGASDFDIFDKNMLTYATDIYNLVVMEVKYNEFLPGVIRDMLKVRSSMLAASKYVYCRMALDNFNLKGC